MPRGGSSTVDSQQRKPPPVQPSTLATDAWTFADNLRSARTDLAWLLERYNLKTWFQNGAPHTNLQWANVGRYYGGLNSYSRYSSDETMPFHFKPYSSTCRQWPWSEILQCFVFWHAQKTVSRWSAYLAACRQEVSSLCSSSNAAKIGGISTLNNADVN